MFLFCGKLDLPGNNQQIFEGEGIWIKQVCSQQRPPGIPCIPQEYMLEPAIIVAEPAAVVAEPAEITFVEPATSFV